MEPLSGKVGTLLFLKANAMPHKTMAFAPFFEWS
jgi:hypothetical protein